MMVIYLNLNKHNLLSETAFMSHTQRYHKTQIEILSLITDNKLLTTDVVQTGDTGPRSSAVPVLAVHPVRSDARTS